MEMEADFPVKTTRKAFEILETIVDEGGAEPRTIEEKLEMAPSTLNDHLRTMRKLGYVLKKGETYYISSRFLELGTRRRHQMPLFRVSKPEIQNIANETSEHASLMIEENGRGVFLYSARADDAARINIDQTYPGARSELHATAPGKAILSVLPERKQESILNRYELKRKTEHTITDRERLYEEIAKIQEQGYALSNEEIVEGVRAIAVPVIDKKNSTYGAIAIYGLSNRIGEEVSEGSLSSTLKDTANMIEINLNYSEF